jgi:hypothetical protein
MAWRNADLDQRQRVQTALFPGGLRYDREKGILNPGNDCLFSQLQNFLDGNMNLVELSGIEPLTSSLRNGFLMYFNNIAEQDKALLSGKQPVEILIVSMPLG